MHPSRKSVTLLMLIPALMYGEDTLRVTVDPKTVEIACVDKDGYAKMDSGDALKHLGKLS